MCAARLLNKYTRDTHFFKYERNESPFYNNSHGEWKMIALRCDELFNLDTVMAATMNFDNINIIF